jgi:hypothetical protein
MIEINSLIVKILRVIIIIMIHTFIYASAPLRSNSICTRGGRHSTCLPVQFENGMKIKESTQMMKEKISETKVKTNQNTFTISRKKQWLTKNHGAVVVLTGKRCIYGE